MPLENTGDGKDAMMPIPLKVVDRAELLTGKLMEHVRERSEKLSHFFNRVQQCRVTVDGPGQHALRGRIRVRIYLSVPGSEIAINRLAAEDLPIAIRKSFDAADRRLEDYVRSEKKSLKKGRTRSKRGG